VNGANCSELRLEYAAAICRRSSLILAQAGETAQSVLGVTGNSQLVGETLYGQYLLPFEIASILLLVAIVGSVAMSKRKTQAE